MPAITVENLSKSYRIGLKEEIPDTLVGALSSWAKAPVRNFRRLRRLNTFQRIEAGGQRSEARGPRSGNDPVEADTIWALKDVSFAVEQGEVVGVIGRNGAGKSTLLKILSRITEPTEGRAVIRGRVSSLLEVGTGFHPELTGRENVYMNGTILGMSKREIDRKFNEIIAFSGVERFLDTPVKRYSSGMKVRLAFSVAAHLDPEILIVDEVLAVGDAEFQSKCLGKMSDVARRGRTVLFVSHNMGALQNLCRRGVTLAHGRIVDDGASVDVVRRYLGQMSQECPRAFTAENPERRTAGALRLISGRILDGRCEPSTELQAGDPMILEFEYENPEGHTTFEPTIVIRNSDNIAVFHLRPALTGFHIRARRTGIFRCTLPRLSLPLGRYRVAVAIDVDSVCSDQIPNALFFTVEGSRFFPTGMLPGTRYCCALTDQVWQTLRDDRNGHARCGTTAAQGPCSSHNASLLHPPTQAR